MQTVVVTNTELAQRVLKARAEIFAAIKPFNQYMPYFIQFNPSFSSDSKQKKVRMVINLKQYDLKITELLEKLPAQIKGDKK